MTAAASMAQVNVRMTPELKAAGEAAMAACGLTPTEVLRWVYQTFADGRGSISHLLHEGTKERAARDMPTDEDRGAIFLRGIDDRYRSLYLDLGLDPAAIVPYADDELDRRYWDERDFERGLGVYDA